MVALRDKKIEILTKRGRIKRRFQPSIYFDSSVLIDYWVTEGLEFDPPEELQGLEQPTSSLSAMRDILNSDVRLSKVVEIRKKLVREFIKATCVISPLAIIETIEWHAEATFKNIAAEAVGVLAVQRKSKKEIGRLVSRILEKRRDEVKNKIKGPHGSSTGLEILHSDMVLNPAYAKAHGFRGLFAVDLINFRLDISQTFDLPFVFAHLQMGLADILHIMAARHLGCTHIASFDSDYSQNKNHIEEGAKLKVLSSPEEILKVIAG
jgi:hypothetical protein